MSKIFWHFWNEYFLMQKLSIIFYFGNFGKENRLYQEILVENFKKFQFIRFFNSTLSGITNRIFFFHETSHASQWFFTFARRKEAWRGEKLSCFFTKRSKNSGQARKDDSFVDKITSLFAPAFFLLSITPPSSHYSSKMKRSCLFSPIFMKNPLASLLHFIKSSDFFVPSMLDYTLFHFSSFSFPTLSFSFSLFFWESFRSSSFNGRHYISWNIKGRTRRYICINSDNSVRLDIPRWKIRVMWKIVWDICIQLYEIFYTVKMFSLFQKKSPRLLEKFYK